MPLAAARLGGAPTEYERLQGFALWPPRARTAQHQVLMGAALLVLAKVAVAVADQYGATDDTPDHRLFGHEWLDPSARRRCGPLGPLRLTAAPAAGDALREARWLLPGHPIAGLGAGQRTGGRHRWLAEFAELPRSGQGREISLGSKAHPARPRGGRGCVR